MEAIILDRIADLWKLRKWYRENRWAEWSDLRRENYIELRALVKLARAARKRPDPMDQYKSFASWSESEKAGAWGR
jgi:hypothetical protein